MASSTFDPWQIAYVLGMQAGGAQGQQGDPSTLAELLANKLDSFYGQAQTISALGQWSTAWGPAIFEETPSTSSYADNAMYVAVSADRSMYVVCIAGTNADSTYDKNVEDEDVNNMSSWRQAFGGTAPDNLKPCVSVGTEDGVNALFGMKDPNSGQSLAAFLGSIQSTTSTLIFSGHSLGAALAPIFALALFDPSLNSLSKSDWSAVYTYPTAGPTPGNGDLSTFFSLVFGASVPQSQPYQVWNKNIWNSLDVVPHAWNIETLGEITNLYPAPWTQNPPVSPPPKELSNAVAYAKHLSNQGAKVGGPYTMLPNQELTGTFNTNIPVSDVSSFEQQALYQHITAYYDLLNVQAFAPAANASAFAPAVKALLTGKNSS